MDSVWQAGSQKDNCRLYIKNLMSGHSEPTFDLHGMMDHFLIYNRALSATEILNLYRSPFCMFEVDL